jgi:hypothetical protein
MIRTHVCLYSELWLHMILFPKVHNVHSDSEYLTEIVNEKKWCFLQLKSCFSVMELKYIYKNSYLFQPGDSEKVCNMTQKYYFSFQQLENTTVLQITTNYILTVISLFFSFWPHKNDVYLWTDFPLFWDLYLGIGYCGIFILVMFIEYLLIRY